VDREVHRIAQYHNDYYSRMKPAMLVFDRYVLEIHTESKWVQMLKLILFRNLQMQVIRNLDTVWSVIKTAMSGDRKPKQMDAAAEEYVNKNLFVKLLVKRIQGGDITDISLGEFFDKYRQDNPCA